MAKFNFKKDVAADKKAGIKEGSKKDVALDKKRGVMGPAMAKLHKSKGK